MFAYADGLDVALSKINANIINPAIEFAFIIATVVFLWGVLEFIYGANDKDKRQQGKDHMLWGFVGFLIMFGVFGIITILTNTIGVKGLTLNEKQQTFVPPPIQAVSTPKLQ
jgi:predicted cobalt transporter CbtA